MTVEQINHMPPGRVVNKAAVAEFFQTSVATVDSWVRRGCPVVQRGDRGTPWQIDLLEVAKWRYSAVPDQAGSYDPDQLGPKERLDHFRAERERDKHMEERGELIPAVEYEQALSSALKTVAVTLESLPDVLERDAGIDGQAVERCQDVIDRVRDDLYQRLTQ
jgi:phage terminase Nu1 subunit (DNA packaging protein)